MARINAGDICEIVGTLTANDGRRVIALRPTVNGASPDMWDIQPLQIVAACTKRHLPMDRAVMSECELPARYLRPIRPEREPESTNTDTTAPADADGVEVLAA